MGFLAGAATGAAFGIPAGTAVARLFATADSPYAPQPGPVETRLSVCALCPGGCGIRVRTVGGRAVKLDGNPRHAVSGGRMCAKGQAGLQLLYHPDRILHPLRRVGPRGSLDSFAPRSWEEAFAEVGGLLRALREGGRAESLVLVRGGTEGLGTRVSSRFLAAFGSPNEVRLERGDEAAALALELTQGIRALPVPDLARADYVLSIGSALLEASASPVATGRAFGAFRQTRTGRRGKLVQVEPRLSLTAAAADEWIPVRPGTEGIFALGVAAALLKEELVDRAFLAAHGAGYEGGASGLRALLERDYGLEGVAAETGVPVNTLLRVARELHAAPAALALGPRRGPLLPGPLFDHLAVQALNGLLGNLDAEGGMLVPEATPLPPWPSLPARGAGAEGRARPRLDGAGGEGRAGSDPEALAEAILSGRPYPAELLLLQGADPLLASCDPARFAAALDRVPMVVALSVLPTESALHADWIWPEALPLERWDLLPTPPGVAYPMASLAGPVMGRPRGEARPAAEIFLELGRRVGGEVEGAFPAQDPEGLLRREMVGLFRARRGALMGTDFDEAWVRMMEGAGWWAPGYRSAEELWQGALGSGGWWDPFYDHGEWARVLRTPSGKFEFRADLLARWRPEAPGAGEDLALLLFEPLPIAGGMGAALPFLPSALDPAHGPRWETWAELHPETAASHGVKDGAWVRVVAGGASILARAFLTPRIVRGAVALPVGLGSRAGGRWARDLGSNPLALVQGSKEPHSGLPDLRALRVRLEAASGPEGGR